MYEDAGDYGFIYGDEGNPLQPLIGFYQLAGGDSSLPARLAAIKEANYIDDPQANLRALFTAAYGELTDLLRDDPRFSAIFFRRIIVAESLQSLGQDFGITRERVRQLETKLKKAIGDPTQTIYGALAHVLAKKFLPLTPVSYTHLTLPTTPYV